jgi:hypothetical protein
MKKLIILMLMLATPLNNLQAQTCATEEVKNLLESCGDAYYRYAPYCIGGSGACLSLYLHSLQNQDLFGYREDLRRSNYTPLKQKRFKTKRASQFKRAFSKMAEDYKDALGAEFCARMDSMWIYNLSRKSFVFPETSLLSHSSSMYAPNNVVPMEEKLAGEVEDWDMMSGTKFAFFRLLPPKEKGGKVRYVYTRFLWLLSNVEFSEDGQVEISGDEPCTKLDGSGKTHLKVEVKTP